MKNFGLEMKIYLVGSTNFHRNWNDYNNGFGKFREEFWLGNENLYYHGQWRWMDRDTSMNSRTSIGAVVSTIIDLEKLQQEFG